MFYCSTKCKKWSTYTIAVVFLVLGVFLASAFNWIFWKILYHQLSLSDKNTKGYNMWKETPIPMYLEFNLFNWTNAEEYVLNPNTTKPKFKELGPYTFYEHHIRENIVFNDNDTVTFYNTRTWKFDPNKTDGTLDDKITILNPIVVTIANIVKFKHYIVKLGIDFFLEEKREKLFVTKTVRELLFDGYSDPLLDLVHHLNMSIHIPFKKFGWFVERNNSKTYDGIYNMYRGGDDMDKLGVLYSWNYNKTVSLLKGHCSYLNGTTGELWYPPRDKKTVSIFAPDLCSNLDLDWEGSFELNGIQGHKYVAHIKNFDNGSIYPDQKCFVPEGVTYQPSGVRNVTACKFGAPALVSFPHFLDADPVYREAVEGMNPNRSKHGMVMALEPTTGLPLQIDAALQLNLQLEPIEGIKILTNVTRILMPAFWFKQYATLTDDLSSLTKMLLVAPKVGTFTGYGLLGLGLFILLIAGFLTIRKAWVSESEDTQILTQNSL